MSKKRLEELLDRKDEEIWELQKKVEEFEEKEAFDQRQRDWGWIEHKVLEEDDVLLPVPRLELRWSVSENGYNKWCEYALVYQHFLGEIIRVPLGMTKQSGNAPIRYDSGPNLDLPYRDGTHIRSDAKQLSLPAFVVYNGEAQEIYPEGEPARGQVMLVEK